MKCETALRLVPNAGYRRGSRSDSPNPVWCASHTLSHQPRREGREFSVRRERQNRPISSLGGLAKDLKRRIHVVRVNRLLEMP